MKKFLPFVFPFIALLIVLFLAVRWYNSRTVRSDDGKIADFGDTVKVENLSNDQLNSMKNSAKDEKTIELKSSDGMKGDIRYDLKDGKVYFSVNADLPELTQGVYQVWLKEVGGDAKKKAFMLTYSKGGFTGSAAISADTLPIEVVVSKELKNDDVMETSLFTGVIQKENM
jgi:hypothetical protein